MSVELDGDSASGAQIGLFIPVRNGEAYLEDCIGSMVRQTLSNWRLTILDNCSTDNTGLIAERFASDPRIVYTRNERDVGSIGNYNRCLDLVNTEFYSILSHDDFFQRPDALEAAMKAMNDHPGIGVVYSDVEWVDGAGRKIVEKRMPFRGKVADREPAFLCLVEGRNHFGVPVLIRTECVRGLRYDPAFPLTCDVDFSIACSARTSAYFLPLPAVAIRFHTGNATMRNFKGTGEEFLRLVIKHALPMGRYHLLRFYFRNAINACKKWAFFFYLDHLRSKGRP